MPIVKSSGADIYYESHGTGPAFLFCSETAADGEIWKIFQVPEFSKDHQVVTFDYRGMGKSSKPSSDYSKRAYAMPPAASNSVKVSESFKLSVTKSRI